MMVVLIYLIKEYGGLFFIFFMLISMRDTFLIIIGVYLLQFKEEAFESLVSLLSLKNNIIPPTINLNNPDEDCDLNYTPNVALEKDLSTAMSNSFGFGGHNGVLVFKKD